MGNENKVERNKSPHILLLDFHVEEINASSGVLNYL